MIFSAGECYSSSVLFVGIVNVLPLSATLLALILSNAFFGISVFPVTGLMTGVTSTSCHIIGAFAAAYICFTLFAISGPIPSPGMRVTGIGWWVENVRMRGREMRRRFVSDIVVVDGGGKLGRSGEDGRERSVSYRDKSTEKRGKAKNTEIYKDGYHAHIRDILAIEQLEHQHHQSNKLVSFNNS